MRHCSPTALLGQWRFTGFYWRLRKGWAGRDAPMQGAEHFCHVVVKGLSLSWDKPKGQTEAGTSWVVRKVTVLQGWLNTSFKLRQGWRKSSVVVCSHSCWISGRMGCSVSPHGFPYIFLYIFLCLAVGRGGDGSVVEDSSWIHLMVGWALPRCWVGAEILWL